MHFSKLLLAALATPILAHPGEKHDPHVLKREIHARDAFAHMGKRALDSCSTSLGARQLNKKNVQRRADRVNALREKRGISTKSQHSRRTLAELQKWETVEHNKTNVVGYTPYMPEDIIFGANTSCILTPTITDGPYYAWGETIRQNVKEEKYSDGVDLYLEVQYIDINSCRPVEGAFVDIWQANATGVYSGISVSGNYAEGGYNSTYLRGIQRTDHDGLVNFDTIFPGHYSGRAIHTHLLTHLNATLLPNNTLQAGTGSVAQIGQLFWPEDLRSAVEATYPYNTNTQDIVSNDDDMWSIEQASSAYDPFPEYVYLGENIEDGLFAWIQIGVNATADYTDNDYYSIAAYRGKNGGYANADSKAMGGGGGGAGGGGAPSGSMPASGIPSSTGA
ncbi:intradiol ring-cleavage dioxygenase [Aspergillus ruber CBS 135680]|uniref:Putative GPI anchored dioxygenase n=1 Tax=Aspergillus ruber (strain CBS 135680) TaxID=1388766 RepID=A0A017SG95_ASPRC|nr:putative GPI anchored dioxygenase [Aspergillus ruber CBS 135680]EYE95305.1 putative GPI anchored dioxygenase [Aspergillus ruber CBS 135680]